MANGEKEKILTFDVSDAALEIAGTASGRANITWGICTTNEPGCPPSIVSEDAPLQGETNEALQEHPIGCRRAVVFDRRG